MSKKTTIEKILDNPRMQIALSVVGLLAQAKYSDDGESFIVGYAVPDMKDPSKRVNINLEVGVISEAEAIDKAKEIVAHGGHSHMEES